MNLPIGCSDLNISASGVVQTGNCSTFLVTIRGELPVHLLRNVDRTLTILAGTVDANDNHITQGETIRVLHDVALTMSSAEATVLYTEHYLASSRSIELLSSHNRAKLLIRCFTAPWCSPCQTIKPKLEEFVQSRSHVQLSMIDVSLDSNASVVAEYSVTQLPTFVLCAADGKTIERFVGANLQNLSDLVDSL